MPIFDYFFQVSDAPPQVVWRTPKFLVEPTWGSKCVELRKCGTWRRSRLPTLERVEGRARSLGIRLGRGTRLSSLNLHPKPITKGLVHIREHPWVLGQATGTLTHKIHHGPDSGEATTFPHIVFSAAPRESYIRMAHFPGTPKLESRNCPEIVPVGVPGLWELISPDFQVWSRRGLNQSYISLWELSNAMLHSRFGCREEVDSRLLVVGSQIASLTPGPSFAHNLGCKCPNDQCKGILDIYTSRPFQWHQEHPNERCFGLCCRTLNNRESRRIPNPRLWEWEFHPPTSPKVGLRHCTCFNGPKSTHAHEINGFHGNVPL